ncbi:MAG: double-strand break repair helicase AddA [Hyphomonadaceae bacterium]|nr:double-strand break repair helicase AddA [Hyphomonadaceae bacterium]
MSEPLDPIAEATANQRIAANPATSVFVTANAGSGKTKVLVDRIARLLLLPDSRPSAFLCITYTKAAAAEMQRRLFERLGGWCVADDEKLAAELEKLGAKGADLGKARALFAQALETPGGLRIQTIHAFCERLLARFPLEAGVAPGFDIADEARAASLLGQARADAALDDDAPREAFRRFAAKLHGEGLEAFLDRLALRRAEFHRFAERKGPLFADQTLRDRHGVTQSFDAYLQALRARADIETMRGAIAKLNEGSTRDQQCADRLKRVLDALENKPASLAHACAAFALTGDGDPRDAFATKATQKTHPMLEGELSAFADICRSAYETLNAIERAEDAVAAMALALKLDQAYADAKARAGVLDFDDLIEHAQTLLQRSEAAPWVLYKLDGGIDHILIDEGQDTSPAQWDLITPLQEEFLAGAGAREKARTIFAVGDPKQSIYGFQGADPERFLGEAQRLGARAADAGVAFTAPELRTSFRTVPEVLRAVDETMRNKPLIAGPGASDEIKHLAARGKHSGSVEVWPCTPRPVIDDPKPWDAPVDIQTGRSAPAQLAKHIATRVRDMIAAGDAIWDEDSGEQRAMRPGDVLLLVRARGAMFRELIKALKSAKLPVAGADRMVLRDELAVEDCLALMRVALDPADDLSLACVLKGPWCNLTDDDNDLFPLAYDRKAGETLHKRLMANTDERLAPARALVSEVIARSGADAFAFLSWALETPHGGGETGWRRVFERLGPETRDPIEELLQRALKPAGHIAPTLQRFISDIDLDSGQVKRELEAEHGAVRIMTVHGAKGLEAPIVILPDATGDVGDAPDNGLIFDDDEGPFVSFRTKDDDAKVATARAAHEQRALREHWRLLYVAMTRARDRLIVCGPQFGSSKLGEAKESWRLAVEEALRNLGAVEIDTPYGKGLRYGDIAHAAAAPKVALDQTPLPEWARTVAPRVTARAYASPSRIERINPALFSPRGDGQKRFRRGRLIHGLLQRLPDIAPSQRAKSARNWLERQGCDPTEIEAYATEALAVLDDQRFAAVFGPRSRAEAPIVGEARGKLVSGIVDRLVVDDARVIVLDFKTGRPPPADVADVPASYALQLALYREVLRKIFPAKPVTCALLWTEKPLLMELPPSQLDDVFTTFASGFASS